MKEIKKIIALLLSVTMIFSLFGCTEEKTDNRDSVDVKQESDDYENSEEIQRGATKYKSVKEVPDGYVGIYTVDDLLKVSINPNLNYILMNDLDLSSVSDWSGLTNEAIFEGNGHTIYNLKSSHSGLFDACNIVYNLTLENVDIDLIVTNFSSTGALANRANNMVINCSASGTIDIANIYEDNYNFANVGGLVGSGSKNCNIGTCTNNVSIKCDLRSIIPYCSINITCGGIVGECGGDENDGIFNCVNYGDIDVVSSYIYNEEYLYLGVSGGIVGEFGAGVIDECTNYGNVNSAEIAAGIAGEIMLYNNVLYVTSCDNFGTISLENSEIDISDGECSVGGIVGYIYLGSVFFESCNNYGMLDNNNILSCIGSIVAQSSSSLSLRNCTYVDNAEHNGIAVTIDGQGGLYPESYENKMITLKEAKKLYPNWFKKDN